MKRYIFINYNASVPLYYSTHYVYSHMWNKFNDIQNCIVFRLPTLNIWPYSDEVNTISALHLPPANQRLQLNVTSYLQDIMLLIVLLGIFLPISDQTGAPHGNYSLAIIITSNLIAQVYREKLHFYFWQDEIEPGCNKRIHVLNHLMR